MIRRIYEETLNEEGFNWNTMLFLMGARQVGKTTVSKSIAANFKRKEYFNWDVYEHRKKILSGQKFIEAIFPLEIPGEKPLIIFDELHKFSDWKNYIKGFYDLYKDYYNIIVTGSARLNIFQKGGDSLMGRYFSYTISPFSVGEISANPLYGLFRKPSLISQNNYEALYNYGGFPAPYIKRSKKGYLQWKRSRISQLFREDVRDLTNIKEVSKLELCAQLLEYQSSNILNRTTISKHIQVSIPTVNTWIETLKQFYYVFTIQPWAKNIPHSLIKEPKIFLNDWSFVEDIGKRFENFIATHLKKSVDFWSETGMGEFELYYLRDKKQREVDFLVTKDGSPWMLVEAKTSVQSASKNLYYYRDLLNAPYAFQVTKNMEYVDYDCFSKEGVFIVSAKTFLSQLP